MVPSALPVTAILFEVIPGRFGLHLTKIGFAEITRFLLYLIAVTGIPVVVEQSR